MIKQNNKFWFILFMMIAILLSCTNTKTIQHNNIDNKNILGGWSVVFFTKFNNKQLNNIITMVKAGKINHIDIAYSKSTIKLATRIKNTLEKQSNSTISFTKLNLIDTKDVQYTHNQVIVTLYHQ